MNPQARRRLKALAPAAEDAIPLGGVERAQRIWNATPNDLPDAERLAYLKGVLRMIADPNGQTVAV